KDDNFKLPQKKKLNEYCFIDLGHFATRLFIFVGSKSAATHVISYGGSIIDDAISDLCGVDAKTASEYKRSNYKNVQNREPCRDIYLRIANDVRRAINFYNFNNPESNLNDIYFCGGGAKIKLLKDAITDAVQLNPHSATELFMPKYDNLDEFAISASAVGITLQ
ncbi:MAG: cell division protein FtsA, partial [Clostridia bacterium]